MRTLRLHRALKLRREYSNPALIRMPYSTTLRLVSLMFRRPL